jgi:hypothetical protein
LSDGHLFVDGVDLGASSPEDLSEADATYVSEAPHRAPCASECDRHGQQTGGEC